MRGGAGFHADQAGRELGEERQDFGSAQRPTHEDLALRIDAVDLEDVLRQIEADGANLCQGRLLSMRSTTSSWHSDAGGGGRPPHQARHQYGLGHRLIYLDVRLIERRPG